MQKNLVIVESPAKAKTIEKFLGDDYKVMSSYGHIRDLKKHDLSINEQTLEPEYEIPDEKKKLVGELKSQAKKASQVWLASDEDREGEAISWHLCEVLGLDEEKTKRIVFHEITKPAIMEAIEHPRTLDMNLVDAQQARRVLDRLVGFKLSPVLWRKVKPSLSAGRVQSVAVRLIVEREREIQEFKSESYYSISAIFAIINPDGSASEVKAVLQQRLKTAEEVQEYLEQCKDASFTVESVQKKPTKRTPAPPFTTSTLQQEAARKLGFTVSQTMMIAQHLYESGRITYMRTDSVNLAGLAIQAAKEEITSLYGAEYSKVRQYHTSSKGAQEAHEAIRPTYMNQTSIEGTMQERRLYDLIWKRTAASQMADAEIERTTVNISGGFVATGEVVKFDGFLKVYRESTDDEEEVHDEFAHVLPPLKKGEEHEYDVITLKGKQITSRKRRETTGSEKGKLLPTDIGIVVNDYLMEHFPIIMDYNFTAKVELDFDKIAEGKVQWMKMMKNFDKDFEPTVEKAINQRSERKAGERELGKDPKTGKPVFAKIGRFGPVVQIGVASDKEKPQFAHMPKELSMETITLEQALELFKLPRMLGEYEGEPITVSSGRYGPYILHKNLYASLPKGSDPLTITIAEAVKLIDEKRHQEEKKHLRVFVEDQDLEILDGRYGPYLVYKGKNYRLPKSLHEKVRELSYEEAMAIVNR